MIDLNLVEGDSMHERVAFWSKIIGVSEPKTYRVRKNQITNLYIRHYRYNGYCSENDTLYYQGKLSDTIAVHELLHKKFPHSSEEDVRGMTAIIIRAYKKVPPQ